MALEDRRRPFTWRHHPKRQKLKRRLGAEGVLAIEDLWDHVAQTKGLRHDGMLRNMDAEDIAIAAGWEGDAEKFVHALIATRLLDIIPEDDDPPAALQVHDWTDHQGHVARHDEIVEVMRGRGREGGLASARARAQAKAEASGQAGAKAPSQPPTNPPTNQPTNPPTNQGEGSALGPTALAAEVTRLYNEICGPAGLPKASKATKTRMGHINARKNDGLTEWAGLFQIVASIPFLCGDNNRGWRADLGWIVGSPENVAKILEGKYTRNQVKQRQTTAAGRVLQRAREAEENNDVTDGEPHGVTIEGTATETGPGPGV